MSGTALERSEIIIGLRELVKELRTAAIRHGWDAHWLNFEVTNADALLPRLATTRVLDDAEDDAAVLRTR